MKADVQHICKEPLLNQVNVTIAQDNSSITNCRRKLLRVCRLRGRQQLPLDMHRPRRQGTPYRYTLCALLIQIFSSINTIRHHRFAAANFVVAAHAQGPPLNRSPPKAASPARTFSHDEQPAARILNNCARMPEDNLLLNGIIGAAAGGVATLVRTPPPPPPVSTSDGYSSPSQVTHPFDTIKTRFQANDGRGSGFTIK